MDNIGKEIIYFEEWVDKRIRHIERKEKRKLFIKYLKYYLTKMEEAMEKDDKVKVLSLQRKFKEEDVGFYYVFKMASYFANKLFDEE